MAHRSGRRIYQHQDGTSQRRRRCILLLMLVRRAAHATCLQDLPADAPLGARTRRLNHPRHVVSLHVPSCRRRTCGRPCDVAPVTGRARNERQTGAARTTRRRGSTGNARIQFAGELASQRPPSRERPPLGGGGAGRALSLSLCLSPRSRSIDDAEHRLRQVRGPPACSSAGT